MTDVLFPLEGKRIWVAGHRGMVGSAVVRRLSTEGCEILTADRESLESREIELIEGRAKFVGDSAVAVNGRTLEAENIVNATGSTPRARA